MKYQPKRSAARWLKGAPAPAFACYDSGGKIIDRYTVLYGAPLWSPEMGLDVPFRAMNHAPFHPLGFGQWGEMPSHNRDALGRKIPFSELPPDCQKLVRQDCAPPSCVRAAVLDGAEFYEAEGPDKGFWRWRGKREADCSDSYTLEQAAENYCALAGLAPE